MNRVPCLHRTTHRVTPCLCITEGYACNQGRACPLRDTELANTVPPRKEIQQVNSSKNYRTHSGAWTGFAPRSTEARWPTPPRSASGAGWLTRLVRTLFGR